MAGENDKVDFDAIGDELAEEKQSTGGNDANYDAGKESDIVFEDEINGAGDEPTPKADPKGTNLSKSTISDASGVAAKNVIGIFDLVQSQGGGLIAGLDPTILKYKDYQRADMEKALKATLEYYSVTVDLTPAIELGFAFSFATLINWKAAFADKKERKAQKAKEAAEAFAKAEKERQEKPVQAVPIAGARKEETSDKEKSEKAEKTNQSDD